MPRDQSYIFPSLFHCFSPFLCLPLRSFPPFFNRLSLCPRRPFVFPFFLPDDSSQEYLGPVSLREGGYSCAGRRRNTGDPDRGASKRRPGERDATRIPFVHPSSSSPPPSPSPLPTARRRVGSALQRGHVKSSLVRGRSRTLCRASLPLAGQGASLALIRKIALMYTRTHAGNASVYLYIYIYIFLCKYVYLVFLPFSLSFPFSIYVHI